MAFTHGSKAKVFLNGYDLTGYTTNVAQSGSADTADVSVLGNTAKAYVLGLQDGTMSLSGVLDGAAGQGDEILSGAIAAQAAADNALYLPQGNVLGLPAYGMDSWQTAYEVTADVGDAAKWSASLQSNVGTERLLVHHIFQAEGAGGNSTGVDYGSVSTTNGGVAYLHATAGASLIVKVQDSADNSTFADIGTFTTLNARGFQRLAIAGTVRRYTRCLWTGTGTFVMAFGRK